MCTGLQAHGPRKEACWVPKAGVLLWEHDQNFKCEMREAGGGRVRLTGTGPAGPAAGSAKSGQSRVARAGATCTVATCRVARQFLRELRVSAMGALLAAFAMRVTRKL